LKVVEGISLPRQRRVVEGGFPGGKEAKIRLLHGNSRMGNLSRRRKSGVAALAFQPPLLPGPEILSVKISFFQPFEGPEEILLRHGTIFVPGSEIPLAELFIVSKLLLPRNQGNLPLPGKVVHRPLGNALLIPEDSLVRTRR
jgi:hypothetical protein